MIYGRFWHVPIDFQFPSNVKRKRALTLWTCGMKILSNHIRSFRLLKTRMLSGSFQKILKNTWQPIMRLMESANGVNLPNDGRMTAASISTSYNITTHHLKTNIYSLC